MALRAYIQNGTLPDEPAKAKEVVARADQFTLQDGVLCHVSTERDGKRRPEVRVQPVVPQGSDKKCCRGVTIIRYLAISVFAKLISVCANAGTGTACMPTRPDGSRVASVARCTRRTPFGPH